MVYGFRFSRFFRFGVLGFGCTIRALGWGMGGRRPPPSLKVCEARPHTTPGRARVARGRLLGARLRRRAFYLWKDICPRPLALHPNLGLLAIKVFFLSTKSWRVPRVTGALTTKVTQKSAHGCKDSVRHGRVDVQPRCSFA